MIPLAHANLIDILGVESLPLEERVQLVEQATDLVEMRTVTRIMEVLNTTEREAFMNLLNAEDDDAVTALIDRKNIDVMTIAQEETEKLKHELLGVATEARNDI